jgi:hypothetical protein
MQAQINLWPIEVYPIDIIAPTEWYGGIEAGGDGGTAIITPIDTAT